MKKIKKKTVTPLTRVSMRIIPSDAPGVEFTMGNIRYIGIGWMFIRESLASSNFIRKIHSLKFHGDIKQHHKDSFNTKITDYPYTDSWCDWECDMNAKTNRIKIKSKGQEIMFNHELYSFVKSLGCEVRFTESSVVPGALFIDQKFMGMLLPVKMKNVIPEKVPIKKMKVLNLDSDFGDDEDITMIDDEDIPF